VRQSVFILLDGVLPALPGSSRLFEVVVVSGVVFALLWRGKRVEVSLYVAVRLGVELRLEAGKLLCHAQKATHLYAEDHPDDVCVDRESDTHQALRVTCSVQETALVVVIGVKHPKCSVVN
jgi:hypothetical protein